MDGRPPDETRQVQITWPDGRDTFPHAYKHAIPVVYNRLQALIVAYSQYRPQSPNRAYKTIV